MHILAIESSCDDTSVALLRVQDGILQIVSEKTASQIDVHKKYGGVVPEVAGRKHAEKMLPTIEAVLDDFEQPDAIAVTSGPGLMTGLLVGVDVAKTLSYLWNVPLISVNHIEGHIYSVLLEGDGQPSEKTLAYPALAAIVSGGHTELIAIKEEGVYQKIGGTRDDAAGEAFDKVAKLLHLEYPGGPKISKLAKHGNPKAISFPRPMLDSDDCDMSFAGLKTAALYWLRDNELGKDVSIEDFCASFEQAVVDVLVSKTKKALSMGTYKTLILAGGVSANTKLRQALESLSKEQDILLMLPPRQYCMDNAAMIAIAGYMHAKHKDTISWKDITANPAWRITHE